MSRGGAVNMPAAAPTVIASNPGQTLATVILQNGTGGTLYLGGPNVSNTNYGTSVAAAGSLTLSLAPEDELYAYSVAGSASGLTVFTSP